MQFLFNDRLVLRLAASLGVFLLLFGLVGAAPVTAASQAPAPQTQGNGPAVYRNPLEVQIPGDGLVESCADPAIIRGEDDYWYIYCTTDPLNDEDRNSNGDYNFHLIPILRSYDLIEWEYVGDALQARPDWAQPTSGLWAPDIQFFNGMYYLYFTVPDTQLGGSAIGVATSDSPAGPFVPADEPVVEPHAPPCCPGDRRWTFDPSVITDPSGQKWIYYGSYFGGISVRQLSDDGFTSDPSSQVEVAIANRYEGAFVILRNGYYYLFVSATDCCRGPLTGYSVFVGRSTSPTGPFVDREGVSLLAGRVGGTPVISMNGNEWVGPGHNAVFTDMSGQDWFLYHAINVKDPYFEDAVSWLNKRPVLMDPLVWVDGWPAVRGGLWASDTPQPAPAAQPGDRFRLRLPPYKVDVPGQLIADLSDEFDGGMLSDQWSWVRPPADGWTSVSGGFFNFRTQAADLYVDSNNASVLIEDAPSGPYIVETRVRLDVPAEGCCFNYVQAGLVIYGDDDNFIKLTHVSIWETRQTEFAKEVFPVPENYPRYGNTVVGPPSEWTYLRIAHRVSGGQELYTAYTSLDGENWVRGGTWTHRLGEDASIGLVSMGGEGFTATFDYVRVYRARLDVTPQK